MQAFKDADGREWVIRLSAWLTTRVREATGVDLWIPMGPNDPIDLSVFHLWMDPRKFLGIIWALIEEQAAKAGVVRDDFEKAFTTEVYEAVKVAYVKEVSDFSPLSAVLKRHLVVLVLGEELDPTPASTSNASATDSAASSASTPGPSPSAS